MARSVSEFLRAAAVIVAIGGLGMPAAQAAEKSRPAAAKAVAPSSKPASAPQSEAGTKEHDEHEHEIDARDIEMDREAERLERDGFAVLGLERDDDGTDTARLIAENIVPDLAKELPWPAPGFRYALRDLDGDGGPELFVVLKHWTLCEEGCPIRIYRFDEGHWKVMIVRYADMAAIRPARRPGEKAQVGFIDLGESGKGPVRVRLYRMEEARFAPANRPASAFDAAHGGAGVVDERKPLRTNP